MGEIVKEVRATRRPVLIHMKTYRYFGHSVSDAGLYRTKDEVDSWKAKDPIQVISRELIESKGITEDDFKNLQKKIKAEIQEALDFAEESPEPPIEELGQHVYMDELGNT
jgi:pyruvate dehydrogenase E1 component alpha subunit